jgi:hypothetical protein
MGPCIVNFFKRDQHDATLHNGEFQLTHDSGKKQKKAQQIPDAVYTVLSS